MGSDLSRVTEAIGIWGDLDSPVELFNRNEKWKIYAETVSIRALLSRQFCNRMDEKNNKRDSRNRSRRHNHNNRYLASFARNVHYPVCRESLPSLSPN